MTVAAPSSIFERPNPGQASRTSSLDGPPLSGRQGRFDHPEKCMVTIEWNAKAVRGYPKLLKNLKRALKADGIFTATITLTRVPIEKE